MEREDIIKLTTSLARIVHEHPSLERATRPATSAKRRMMRRQDGERILRDRYREVTGRELDLTSPVTYIDKLYCRMVTMQRQSDPVLTELTDKYRVRDYVRTVLGEEFLVPLYWQGTDPASIPFDTLPPRYVIKSNHSSCHVLRVRGDIARDEVIAETRAWLESNYYWTWREEQYYRIRPRILIEELLDDGFTEGPLDYRFFCFSGRPDFIQVSDHIVDLHVFFDLDWTQLDMRFRQGGYYEVPRPARLDEMIRAAEALSKPFDFVRVDLYNVRGDIRFGELTFTPSAGGRAFEPPEVDQRLGALWQLDPGARPVLPPPAQ